MIMNFDEEMQEMEGMRMTRRWWIRMMRWMMKR